jgi:ABC-type lipoprotein export system ATPase subunit
MTTNRGEAMTASVVVEARELTKVYGGNGQSVRALDRISFTVTAGEFVAVMGPSGCGKSTLLNILGALDRPTSGMVQVAGQDLRTLRDADRFRARTVGFVFQLHNLIPTLTALENVEVPMQGQGLGRRTRHQRAEELLRMVGLGDRLDHLPAQLSGGQRQRVAIARALANQPALLLADEPTGNLDSAASAEIIDLLTRLNAEQRTTILIVTHDPTVARRTRRILAMRDGHVERDERVGSVYEEDLKMLRHSELGQALLGADDGERRTEDILATLGLKQNGHPTAEAEALRRLLEQMKG